MCSVQPYLASRKKEKFIHKLIRVRRIFMRKNFVAQCHIYSAIHEIFLTSNYFQTIWYIYTVFLNRDHPATLLLYHSCNTKHPYTVLYGILLSDTFEITLLCTSTRESVATLISSVNVNNVAAMSCIFQSEVIVSIKTIYSWCPCIKWFLGYCKPTNYEVNNLFIL